MAIIECQKIQTRDDGHFRSKPIVKDLLNNFKWFLRKNFVPETDFMNKKQVLSNRMLKYNIAGASVTKIWM